MVKKLATLTTLLLSASLLCACSDSTSSSEEISSSHTSSSDESTSSAIQSRSFEKEGTISFVSDYESDIYLSSEFEYIYETDEDGTLANESYVFPINKGVSNSYVNSENEIISYGTEKTNLQSLANLYKLPDQVEHQYGMDVYVPLYMYPAGVALSDELDSLPQETITVNTIDGVTSMYHESSSGSKTNLRGYESGEYFSNTFDFTDITDLVLFLDTVNLSGFDLSTLVIDWDTLLDHLDSIDSYNDLFSFDTGLDLDGSAETIDLFATILAIISAGVETHYDYDLVNQAIIVDMVLQEDALAQTGELLSEYFGDNIYVQAESLTLSAVFSMDNFTLSDLNSDMSSLISSGALTLLGIGADGTFLVTDLINDTSIPVDFFADIDINRNGVDGAEISYLDVSLSSEDKYLYWLTMDFDDKATSVETDHFDEAEQKIETYSPIADEFNAFYEPIEGYVKSENFDPFVSKIDITRAGGTLINSYADRYSSLSEEVRYMLSDEVNASTIVAGYDEGRTRLETIPSLYTSSVASLDDIVSLLDIDGTYVNHYLNFSTALEEIGQSTLLAEMHSVLESVFVSLETAIAAGTRYSLEPDADSLSAFVTALDACISDSDFLLVLPNAVFDDYKTRYDMVLASYTSLREAYFVYFSSLADLITEDTGFETLYSYVSVAEFAMLRDRYKASSTVSAFDSKSDIVKSLLSDKADSLLDTAFAAYRESGTLDEFDTAIAPVEEDVERLDLVELYLLGTEATYSNRVTKTISNYRDAYL